jgi:hypothetical protein
MVSRQLVEPRIELFIGKPVLDGNIDQNFRRGRSRRDKIRPWVSRDLLRNAELLSSRADGRRMALNAR